MLTLAVANQNVVIDSLEAAILSEFAKIRERGVTEAELSKAQNLYRTGLITQQQQALVRAEALQSANLFLGDPEAVNTHWKRYTSVTVDDIKRVAQQYFRDDNALILLITPEVAK